MIADRGDASNVAQKKIARLVSSCRAARVMEERTKTGITEQRVKFVGVVHLRETNEYDREVASYYA